MAIAVAVAACAGSAASTSTTSTTVHQVTTTSVDYSSFERYESPTYGFSIAYPGDWTVSEVTAENLIGFTAPAAGTAGLTPNFNVTITDVTPDLVPVAYYDGEIERVKTSLKNADFLEVVNVNVDGVMGRGMTLVTKQEGMDIGISRIIVINNDRAYELSFFAEASDLEQLAPVVTTIFQSMQFIG